MRPTPADPLRCLDWDQPLHVAETHTLRTVAQLLTRYGVGAVLVSRRSGSPRMTSERDIVSAVAAGIDVDDATTGDVVFRDLVVADLDDTVADAARRLLDEGVRHVAVVDDDEVVAVMSMRDLLAVFVDACAEPVTGDEQIGTHR